MKKYTAATLNMILALGVICIFAGILFFAHVAVSCGVEIQSWTFFLTVGGVILFYLSLVLLKYVVFFFTGLYSCLTGALFMFISSGFVQSGVERFWPLAVFLAGVCVLITGIAKDRSIKLPCLVPSVIIIFLSLFFLLFSLDIIKMSFTRWISVFLPALFFVSGLGLIFVFLFIKSPLNKFSYEEDFSSEEKGEVQE